MAVAPPRTVFDVITDFLATNPTPETILAYRLPVELEQRALQLLEIQRAEGLSRDEELEMLDFIRADDMMTLLKAKTRLKLSGKA
ncbi:MAG: hypothetical protein J0M07_16515 [Anaerolineae bacterium]|nr:hypothetical protein [Anaerolineae bacterium]